MYVTINKEHFSSNEVTIAISWNEKTIILGPQKRNNEIIMNHLRFVEREEKNELFKNAR